MEEKWSLDAVIHYLLLGRFIQNTNWFVFEILIFYILFWFLYRTLPNKAANLLLFVATALFIGGYGYRIDNPWYGSSLCFPLGILYAQHERDWNDSVIGNPIARNLAAVSFCLWVLSILQKIKVGHWLLQWLGKISYEIFLLHPLWISIIGKYITEPYSGMMLVIILTIVSSALLHTPIAKIQRKLLKYF